MSQAQSPTAPAGAVTIVTETRVLPEHADDFARWQTQVNARLTSVPGFIDREVIPPSAAQPDWVILQRFASLDAARAWLSSPDRTALVQIATPWLVGHDDVHIVQNDDAAGGRQAPISVVISTQVKPGAEEEFKRWQRKIATVEAQFPGYQGYRLEPPISGVQTDWLTVVRFDTEPHLQAWLASPQREQLLAEGAQYTVETHIRTVRTGFDAWFPLASGAVPPPAWKQNMMVLAVLYPVVFLFGHFVQTPLLMERLGLGFTTALFLGNLAGVLLLGILVPRASKLLNWWLNPTSDPDRINLLGAVVLVVIYIICLVLFAQAF